MFSGWWEWGLIDDLIFEEGDADRCVACLC